LLEDIEKLVEDIKKLIILQLLKGQASKKEIGAIFGVSYKTIERTMCKSRKIESRKTKGKSKK